MLYSMTPEQFTPLPDLGRAHAGSDPRPGHQMARADRLRALLAAEEFFITAATELALGTTSPTEAAALALIVERAHRHTAYAQLLAAQGAQRTLAHELPIGAMEQLSATVVHPAPFIAGDIGLPQDPLTVPTGRLPHRDTADFLQHLLGISYFEARDRVKATTALLAHIDHHGIKQPARYPELSQDARTGTVDPRHAIQTAKKLDKVVPVIEKQPEAAQLSSSLEVQVRDALRTQGPTATGKLITAWQESLEQVAPAEPSDEEISAKTGIFLTRRTKHFSYFSLCMLNVEAEIFLSHFANADNARTAAGNREGLARDAAALAEGAVGTDGKTVDLDSSRIPEWAADPNTPADEPPSITYTDPGMSAAGKYPPQREAPPPNMEASQGEGNPLDLDGLTPARRRLQTILNVLRSSGGSTKNGKGATKATLLVHCQLETLLGLAERAGISAHGLDISPGQLRRLLCDAGVLPIVFNSESRILDLGREQRLVPEYLRQAVLARDGGCLVPGCSVPPEHCEICHIDSWEDGGVTSAENTGPGCSQHHHDFHSGKIKLVRDSNGLPAVILPKYLDPDQIPRRNDYWQHKHQTNPSLF